MAEIDIEKIVQSVVDTIKAGNAGQVDLEPDTTTHEIALNQRDDVKHVALGCDYRALDAKNILKTYLGSVGYRVVDVGAGADDPVEYPDVAVAVARKVASGECERGIMVDMDGIGSAIVCNKVRGIRAALCYDMRSIVNSREHINANVLALGGAFHAGGELCEMAKLWLELRFPSGEHWSALNKITSIERSQREGN